MNESHISVNTWPEGNGWLANRQQKKFINVFSNNCLAVQIEVKDDAIRVIYFDTKSRRLKAVVAAQCIAVVPQFVAALY